MLNSYEETRFLYCFSLSHANEQLIDISLVFSGWQKCELESSWWHVLYYIYIDVCLFCTSSLLLDFLAASCVFRCLLDSYLVSETISGDDRSKQAQNGFTTTPCWRRNSKKGQKWVCDNMGDTLKWQWAMAKLINHVIFGRTKQI